MAKYVVFVAVICGSIFLWTISDTSPDFEGRVKVVEEVEFVREKQIVAKYRNSGKVDNDDSDDDLGDKSDDDVKKIEKNRELHFRGVIKERTDLIQMIASIRSPEIDGHKLQASDIFIHKPDTGNKTNIYVSYNRQGPIFNGAVQIITATTKKLNLSDMEDWEDKKKLEARLREFTEIKLSQTITFNDCDIHSLSVKNNTLYLVGAAKDLRFKTPASLEVIKLKNGLFPEPFKSKRVDLPSFAATSVAKVKNKIFVSVGDKDGGIIEIKNPHKIKDKFAFYTDLDFKFYPAFDARYVTYNDDYIFSVLGTNAGLWVKNRKEEDKINLIPLEGATISESRSSVEVSEDFIFVGLGNGGANIWSLDNFEMVNQIPQNDFPELPSELTVTNYVSADRNQVYTADGEAGARVFKIDSKANLEKVASIRFGAGMSVNAIKKFNEFIVFATGMGGVKIAHIYSLED